MTPRKEYLPPEVTLVWPPDAGIDIFASHISPEEMDDLIKEMEGELGVQDETPNEKKKKGDQP